jgi:drug/metabolite transporter (DMT)-like permease
VTDAHLGFGVLMSVLSTLLYNVGFVLEKHGLEDMPPVHARRIVHLALNLSSSPVWVIGFCSMLGGLALQVVALSLAPISVVQPIFVSGIVVLLVLSHVTLKERIGRNEWIAIGLIGVTLLCISLSLDLSTDRAGDTARFGSLVAAALPTILGGVLFFMGADKFGSSRLHTNARAGLYGVGTGLIYGVGALAIKSVSTIVERHGLWLSIPHVLASPYLYTFAVASGLGLLLFQTALQRCPASVVVPASNVVSATYVVAVGTIIFSEHLPTTTWKLVLRVIGFAGVFLGVLLLANTKPAAPEMPLIEEPVSLPLPHESAEAAVVEVLAETESHRGGADGRQ